MWHTLRIAPEASPDFTSVVTELIQSMTRTLILATLGILLSWYGLVALTPTAQWTWVLPNVFLVTTTVGLVSALALWLLSRRPLTAQLTWVIGLGGSITLGLHLFQQPEAAFLYALIPLVATITVGWPAGIGSVVAVSLLAWALSSNPAMPALSLGQVQGIVAGGLFTGVLGWAATRALLTVSEWSILGFQQARERMNEALDQRVELKQVQQDLIQANVELARLSDRLAVMQEIAEEARRAKEEFVANVSHELRTPLNMIIGFSEMIVRSPQVYRVKLPPTLLADIDAIHRNSQHLSRLVNDVLDLSQVEAGRMAFSKEWVSMEEIIDSSVLVVRPLFKSKGLDLQTEVAVPLPPIFCDGTRIRQVLVNLLSNAGRFTERGGVGVKAWTEEGSVIVSVTDTGPGIPQEDRERIFEPFQQLDASIRRRHGGSGLGLSISRHFVEMHGGAIWLQSEVGVGTSISFSLPVTASPLATLDQEDARRWFDPYVEYDERTRPSALPALEVPPRFVVLEKGETLERLFSRYMSDADIVAVRDGHAALHELSRLPAHALVINTSQVGRLPEPLDRLPHLPYGAPAISCWAPGDDRVARELGVVRYMVKPIAPDALLSALEDLGDQVETILLVDDEPEALQLLSRVLSLAQRNYRAVRARNGEQALRLLRQRHPDAMILDLIMPGVDGFQVLQEKGQDPSIQQIPVIVVTSRDPARGPIVSNSLTVTQGGGLAVRDLIACIQAVSDVLAPSARAVDRAPQETPAG